MTEQLVKSIFEQNRDMSDMSRIQSENAKWKPSYTFDRGYDNHHNLRDQYYNNDVQDDIIEELKRRAPNSWELLQYEQINLGILRFTINAKAQVFSDKGEFYLVDTRTNERVEGDDAEAFEEMNRRARTWSCLKELDAKIQLHHRALSKPWWSTYEKKARLSNWSPQATYIVPDIITPWEVDKAPIVALATTGPSGVVNTDYKYELWGYDYSKPIDQIKPQDTFHYISDGDEAYSIEGNEDRLNPFIDPRTDNSMYPFMWFYDEDSTELYVKGNANMLEMPRRINTQLTELGWAVAYKSMGIWVHSPSESGGDSLGVKNIMPHQVVDISPGATLGNIAPDLPITEVWDWNKALVESAAHLDGIGVSAIRTEGSIPEWGYAYKLKSKNLLEHRNNMTGIYKERVEELIYRLCVVHNTYAEEGDQIKGLENYRVNIEFGDLELPINPLEEIQQALQEHSQNISTPVDLRMSLYDEERQEAESNVRDNATLNKELAALGKQAPQIGQGFALAALNQAEAEEEEEEETKEETEQEPEAEEEEETKE
jgi:hypothetical protein